MSTTDTFVEAIAIEVAKRVLAELRCTTPAERPRVLDVRGKNLRLQMFPLSCQNRDV